jgi:hypothetical protein
MPYKIERYKFGVVKRFSGVVTFEDVLRSEQEIHSDPEFTRFRYVVSDYTGAEYHGLTDSQKADVNTLRIGGHYSNTRTKYAFVNLKPEIRAQIESAVENGEMLHQTQMFDTLEEASDWAGVW